VRPRITTPFPVPAGNGPTRIAHLYVTIRGIEANPSAIAGGDSPDWQELAPKLVKQPAQVDLLAPTEDSLGFNTLEYAAVPADVYRQIRLRLSPNEPDASDSIPGENFCGSVGLNCLVTSDGSVQPLVLANELSQMQIPSDKIAGGFFRVLPEAAVNLEVEFNPQSSLFIPTGETVQLVPVLTVESQAAEQSADADP
jgi:Domain of unknown function (DUF4382)